MKDLNNINYGFFYLYILRIDKLNTTFESSFKNMGMF